jgi:two-component system sensor histidine kinase/response regulator
MAAWMDAAKPETVKLLVVDDEEPQMRALCATLAVEGFTSTGVTSPQSALRALLGDRFDLLLTDLQMPGMDGIALLAAAREIDPQLVGIVMTGHGTIDTAVKAMQAGALDYIQKPFKLKAILPVLRRGLEIRRLRSENVELRETQTMIRRLNDELEQRVRERTHELEVANQHLALANKDLESFSFSVSHDLRAPLRTMRGFCDIFIQEFGEAVPPEGRVLLERMREGGVRMSQLIEDLLAFARFSRQPLQKLPVSMEAIARKVVAELQAREDRQVDARVRELPDCNGDASLLEQVFTNLLSNAFKFSRARESAIVEVGSMTSSSSKGVPIFYVRDNGAGFDMKYADKLFGVFQRLHSATEFEGTGVGLSIVQRIVQRHGGRIWAESAPGEGATFFFTLACD